MDRQAAETLAAEALAFLAEDPARLRRFFLATGLEPDDVRARAGSPELLQAVLEYLAGDETLLLVFAASRKLAAERVTQAIPMLASLP